MAVFRKNNKWLFRGEGNGSLVLANREEKRVYRLAKSQHWGHGHLATNSMSKPDRIHEELGLVVDYMQNVMQPLLSPSFVVLPVLCLIPRGLIDEAEEQIQTSRPAQRKGKEVQTGTIDPTTPSALVLPDLCYVRSSSPIVSSSPTLSVEIKPKKAFMHHSDVSGGGADEKTQVCKFCMHQRLKAKEGEWPNTSRYCPLDLFSGDRKRMKQALLALAETPQNNLRICQNGEEIHGAWNKEDLSEVLQTFFGDLPNGLTNGLRKQKAVNTFLHLVLEALLSVPNTGTSNDAHSCTRNELDNEQTRSDKTTEFCNPCGSHSHFDEFSRSDGCCDIYETSEDGTSQRNNAMNLTLDASHNCEIIDPSRSTQLPETTEMCQICQFCLRGDVQYCQNSSYIPDKPVCSNCCELPRGCVLERVLSAQRLDSLDIQQIYPLYLQLDTCLRDNPASRCELCLDGPYTGPNWLAEEYLGPGTCRCIRDPHLLSMVGKVKRFLVSKTVQDCSIMVAMQRVSDRPSCSKENYIADIHGQLYRFSVSIVDLDPKPFCKIPTYHKQDMKIVNAYREACRSQLH